MYYLSNIGTSLLGKWKIT